jgi:hypothetical protein
MCMPRGAIVEDTMPQLTLPCSCQFAIHHIRLSLTRHQTVYCKSHVRQWTRRKCKESSMGYIKHPAVLPASDACATTVRGKLSRICAALSRNDLWLPSSVN